MTSALPLFVVVKDGKFLTRGKRFLENSSEWIKTSKPSHDVILRELSISDAAYPMWSTCLQEAETWSTTDIDRYIGYFPDANLQAVGRAVENKGGLLTTPATRNPLVQLIEPAKAPDFGNKVSEFVSGFPAPCALEPRN